MHFRDYAYLGTTQSLCPTCLSLIPAKIIARDQRVYFRKQCPQHGIREDFVCADVKWFDRMEYSLPGRVPREFRVDPRHGCPYDCGLCTEHEQHTCIGVLEINSACNLECPMCYASSSPRGTHLPADECVRAMDHLVAAEGRPEVLQLSGGEPTIHPNFVDIFRAACDRPIDLVMINTNGIRLARDDQFLQHVAALRHRCEVYLQFDGFQESVHGALRGEELLAIKLRTVERLGEAGINTILVCTVQTDVNEHELGRIVEFAVQRPHITGVSFQPACYVGRSFEPAQLERRITFPDIIRLLEEQTCDWTTQDFLPLPCAHPNEHSLAYAYRTERSLVPLARFMDIDRHTDLLANGITFTRSKARELIAQVLSRAACGSDCGCLDSTTQLYGLAQQDPSAIPVATPAVSGTARIPDLAREFFSRALAEDLKPRDVFRITTTSFMDAYNFDIRQLIKSCVHFVLPSGHLIPFSAYNLFYRDGQVPLPELKPGRVPLPTG